MFLKECQIKHPRFRYSFYDPDRAPSLAKELHVKDLYTIIVRYESRQERIVRPTEESFTNALFRLASPRTLNICFVTGHGEAAITREDRDGYKLFREALEDSNYVVHEIILARDKVPALCHVVSVAGPHRDLDRDEWNLVRRAFREGRGVLFLIDPMDPGTGEPFIKFMREIGVVLGMDVVVDKMSRMVGGDFLVPLVSQYVNEHPITSNFDMATFFPVARSVQPSTESREDLEVTPLAFSSSGSWAETNLKELEAGEAAFETEFDLSGPIPIAVAVEEVRSDGLALGGRMVVVGDSDFLTNAYVDLSGNRDFALRMVQWVSKDDRILSIRPRQPKFEPLLMTRRQRLVLLSVTLLGLPVLCLLLGSIRMLLRNRQS